MVPAKSYTEIMTAIPSEGAVAICSSIHALLRTPVPPGAKDGTASPAEMDKLKAAFREACELGTSLAQVCGSWDSTATIYRQQWDLHHGRAFDPGRLDSLADRGLTDPNLLAYVREIMEFGVSNHADVDLPTSAPLRPPHASVLGSCGKIIGTLFSEASEGGVTLFTTKAQDSLKVYSSPPAAVPKRDLLGRPKDSVRIIMDLAARGRGQPSANDSHQTDLHPGAWVTNVRVLSGRVIDLVKELPGVPVKTAKVDISSAFRRIYHDLNTARTIGPTLPVSAFYMLLHDALLIYPSLSMPTTCPLIDILTISSHVNTH